jgi:hypothetical protein
VLLLLIHELGHAAAARSAGLRVGAPVLIPFVGAYVSLSGRRRSAGADAFIAAGGPAAGAAGSLIALGIAALLGPGRAAESLRALAGLGALLNLLNLFPVPGLDGGRWSGSFGWREAVAAADLHRAGERAPRGPRRPAAGAGGARDVACGARRPAGAARGPPSGGGLPARTRAGGDRAGAVARRRRVRRPRVVPVDFRAPLGGHAAGQRSGRRGNAWGGGCRRRYSRVRR